MEIKRKNRQSKILVSYILLFVVFIIAFTAKRLTGPASVKPGSLAVQPQEKEPPPFQWDSAAIFYSKHARCRMECRHITEEEVKEILHHPFVNYKKSQLDDKGECKKRFALEGYTSMEHQHIRIIAAPCGNDKLTVITCIDLEQNWPCNCDTSKAPYAW